MLHSVKHFETLISLDMDGRSWRRGEAWVLLDDDSVLELKTGDTWDGVNVLFDRRTMYETGTTVVANGLRGVLDIEVSNNPHGGFEPLTNALQACAVDGLSRRPVAMEKHDGGSWWRRSNHHE